MIPTLHAGELLHACVQALRLQSFHDFEVIVVDNSASGAARPLHDPPLVSVVENDQNVGFGAAINQAVAITTGEFICCLNDDTVPEPDWLGELVAAAENRPAAGMAAPTILLRDRPGLLDSSGLSLFPDGIAKQRGHGLPAEQFSHFKEALLPSGCSALYRRRMLDEIGLFDEDYFLYCEDTDLGLRARLAGWECAYAPASRVAHAYSVSAGRASRLKAFLVERNRLLTVLKVYPLVLLPLVPFYSLLRYSAHLWAALTGRGLSGEIHRGGESWWRLGIIVVSAHAGALALLPRTWRKRRRARALDRLGAAGFWKLIRKHRVSAMDVALQ